MQYCAITFFLDTLGNLKLNLPTIYQSVHLSIEAKAEMDLILNHHNKCSNFSDHMTQYIKGEFIGSKAAGNFPCGRSETAAIINCIGDHLWHELIREM